MTRLTHLWNPIRHDHRLLRTIPKGQNTVLSYITDAERDKYIPNPNGNLVIWNDSVNSFQKWEGSEWVTLGPSKPVYQGQALGGNLLNGGWFVDQPASGYLEWDSAHSFNEWGASLKGNQGGSSTNMFLTWLPNPHLNLTNKYVYVRFYLHDASYTLSLRFWSPDDGAGGHLYALLRGDVGWNEFLFQVSEDDPIVNASGSWTGDPDDVWKLYFTFDEDTTRVSLDAITIYEDHHIPIVVPSVDDNDEECMDYKTHCDDHGYTMTAFVVPDWVGDTGKLTLANLQTLHDAGWDIANHTETHAVLTNVSAAVAEQEIVNCRDWLRANGFTQGIDFLAYPGGYQDATIRGIARKYCRIARGADLDDRVGPPLCLNNVAIHDMPSRGCDSLTNAEFETYIDKVIASGGCATLFYHDKTPDDATDGTQSFEHDIDYLAAKEEAGLLKVMNMTEYYEYLQQRYAGNWYGKVDVMQETADYREPRTITRCVEVDMSGGGSGQTQVAASVPANSLLHEVAVKITETLDGDTDKNLDVGDGSTVNLYVDGSDDLGTYTDTDSVVMSDPANTQTVGPQLITADTDVTVTWTNAANATAGKALVWVTYTPAHNY